MIDKKLIDTEEKALRAFLVGIWDKKTSKKEAESLAKEILSLSKTLDLETACQQLVHVREYNARFGMGTGKAEEIANKAIELKADCIVFDRDINPSQQRNWEKLSGLPVLDRQELILQIFSGRAKTREAGLQVELARLYYMLPRLQHKYIDLNRQRGGRYGTKGSGETKLETDRRQLEQQIHKLEDELEEVRRQRGTRRKLREKNSLPVCALTGYTNAGKSSILNALTGAVVIAEDKLFATLDSTGRRLELKNGPGCLLVDTVGFIRRLPHNLINAFRSTLEELSVSNVLLHIVDVSDPDLQVQYETALSVLKDLNADTIPRITVLNKIDALQESNREPDNFIFEIKEHSETVSVSALTGEGLSLLLEKIENAISGKAVTFRFPHFRSDLAAMIHRSGSVISENYGDDFIEMKACTDERTRGKLREFVYE